MSEDSFFNSIIHSIKSLFVSNLAPKLDLKPIPSPQPDNIMFKLPDNSIAQITPPMQQNIYRMASNDFDILKYRDKTFGLNLNIVSEARSIKKEVKRMDYKMKKEGISELELKGQIITSVTDFLLKIRNVYLQMFGFKSKIKELELSYKYLKSSFDDIETTDEQNRYFEELTKKYNEFKLAYTELSDQVVLVGKRYSEQGFKVEDELLSNLRYEVRSLKLSNIYDEQITKFLDTLSSRVGSSVLVLSTKEEEILALFHKNLMDAGLDLRNFLILSLTKRQE